MGSRRWARDEYERDWADFPRYVSVAERQKSAAQEIAAFRKKGREISPVKLEGRAIATTFWGKAWCQNLERYSDYESRLPRGRSYVRSGSVVDLQIAPGKVSALVRGNELYKVTITIGPVEPSRWKAIIAECTGKIGSVIELLQGKLSSAVMEVITSPQTGLFPAPKQIRLQCSCPDAAILCKHAAAALYGVGARLDREPELLFRLRGVDPAELSSTAAAGALSGARRVAKEKVLGGDLASVFGIELDPGPAKAAGRGARPPRAEPKKSASPPGRHRGERRA